MVGIPIQQRLRAPLHVHVAMLFLVLVFAVGGALAWLNYIQTSQLLLSAADEWVTQTTERIREQLDQRQRTLAASLRMISHAPLLEAGHWEARQPHLDWLQQALDNHAIVTALHVGYANGDWLSVRPLRSPETRSRFSAPNGTVLLVDHLTTEDGQRVGTRRFFSGQLNLLHSEPTVLSHFDPRTRLWFAQARASTDVITTAPHVFYFDNTAGMTLAHQSQAGSVLGADIALASLSDMLASLTLPPGSQIAMVDASLAVIACTDKLQSAARLIAGEFRQPPLANLAHPIWQKVATTALPTRAQFEWRDETWRYQRQPITFGDQTFYLLTLLPESELLKEAKAIRHNNLMFTLLTVLLAIPLAWFLSRLVSSPLRQLVRDTATIRRFDFSAKIHTRSFVREIDELGRATGMMQNTLRHFLEMIDSLAGERHFHTLVQKLTEETRAVANAWYSGLFLYDEKSGTFNPEAASVDPEATSPPPSAPLGASSPEIRDLLTRGESQSIATSSRVPGEVAIVRALGLSPTEPRTLTLIPLRNREKHTQGLLLLLEARDDAQPKKGAAEEQSEADARLGFVKAIAGFAAVSLETRQLLQRQKQLLNAVIELIAGAIDSKSPHTSGHCQRVPELTRMLTKAACDCNHGPFADFSLDPEAWEAVHIASWLHDCGKVTTPEYVVDKATKLETLYDRIHEIRMRFEVLKKESEYTAMKEFFGSLPPQQQATLSRTLDRLDTEFAFVARCNLGGESLAEADIRRLHEIGRQTWTRTLDDTLGVSEEERQRLRHAKDGAHPSLPVLEPLLADKDHHLYPREPHSVICPDNPWGFRLETPHYLFNKGELYNLSISRGTLTPEERFLIKDHIVQTIIMLRHLPYPDHLKEVPAIAGGHHEHMDGSGYPCRLRREDMPVTARIMAIADIFEALTASDRPYKSAMSLSQTLTIMTDLVLRQHIDPDLYLLFLEAGVYRDYAQRFLAPAQCDDVDIRPHLEAVRQFISRIA